MGVRPRWVLDRPLAEGGPQRTPHDAPEAGVPGDAAEPAQAPEVPPPRRRSGRPSGASAAPSAKRESMASRRASAAPEGERDVEAGAKVECACARGSGVQIDPTSTPRRAPHRPRVDPQSGPRLTLARPRVDQISSAPADRPQNAPEAQTDPRPEPVPRSASRRPQIHQRHRLRRPLGAAATHGPRRSAGDLVSSGDPIGGGDPVGGGKPASPSGYMPPGSAPTCTSSTGPASAETLVAARRASGMMLSRQFTLHQKDPGQIPPHIGGIGVASSPNHHQRTMADLKQVEGMMEGLLVKNTETAVKLIDDKLDARLCDREKRLEAKMQSKMEKVLVDKVKIIPGAQSSVQGRPRTRPRRRLQLTRRPGRRARSRQANRFRMRRPGYLRRHGQAPRHRQDASGRAHPPPPRHPR